MILLATDWKITLESNGGQKGAHRELNERRLGTVMVTVNDNVQIEQHEVDELVSLLERLCGRVS